MVEKVQSQLWEDDDVATVREDLAKLADMCHQQTTKTTSASKSNSKPKRQQRKQPAVNKSNVIYQHRAEMGRIVGSDPILKVGSTCIGLSSTSVIERLAD